MTEFKPYRMPVPDGYRSDDLSNAYADAAEEGLWLNEWGGTPDGSVICAVGSYYMLQRWEHEHPDEPELDPSKFTLGDCIEISLPGRGDTRVEAIRDGIRAFKASPLWKQHAAYHEEATP